MHPSRFLILGLPAAALVVLSACGGGGGGTSSNPSATPTVASFTPASGAAGTLVTVAGTNLSGATSVRFNGVPAAFTPGSSTRLTATVPSGASTGPISVTTAAGTATSAGSFTVAAPAGTDVLLNGGFEAPDTGQYWSTGGLVYSTSAGVTPRTGSQMVWIGGYGSADSDTLTTEVGIPSDATAATLRFWLNITTAETGSAAVDTMSVRAYDAATGALLGTLRTLSNLDPTTGWAPFSVDLLAHKGKALRLDWTSQENASLQTSWFMDDVSVEVAAPATGPTVLSVTPTSGYAGEDTLDVLGAFTHEATGITVNGTACTGFTRVNGGRCRGRLAVEATSGVLAVQTPRGTATGPAIAVSQRTPQIQRINPTQGPVGTKVVLAGQYLQGVTSLTLNGVAVPAFTIDSDAQITATIPSGATSGLFRAIAPPGSGDAPGAFTVAASGPTGDYWIDHVHLNQATQTPAGDVPPVAGRDAYLRVFIRANETGMAVPDVQVTLTPSGGTPETLAIPVAPTVVPTTLDLGAWNASVNIPIPAAKVASGVSFQATVNPGGGSPEADGTNNQSTFTPAVKTLSPFRATLIPVTQGGGTGNVTGSNLAQWMGFLESVFPVGEVDAQVGSAWTYNGAALDSEGGGWSDLLAALEQKRLAEGSGRYYYGALNVAYSSGVAGLGYVPSAGSPSGRSAIGWDKTGYGDGGDYPWVYAHETGHNLGRPHSPCGGVSDYDHGFPYLGGAIGMWGLDVATGSLRDPMVYKDIMGYCDPNWVSDYVFMRILDHREATPQPLAPGPHAEEPCLVITAQETDQGFVLGPVLEVPTRPAIGAGTHGFRIKGYDAKDAAILDLPVDVVELGCGPFAGRRAVVAALPCGNGLGERLQRLALVEGGTERAALQVPSQDGFLRKAAGIRARRAAGGRMELTWDAQAFPAAWIRDPLTGEILATLQGGRAILPVVDPRSELRLSDGLRTRVEALPALE